MEQKQLTIIAAFSVLTVITGASLLLSFQALQVSEETAKRYEDALAQLTRYSLIVGMNVTVVNEVPYFISLSLVNEPDFAYHDDGTVRSVIYSFFVNTNGNFVEPAVNPFFVDILIFIPDAAYDIFEVIEASWVIDDGVEPEIGVMRKNNFVESTYINGFWEAKRDITAEMWQDDIPDEINMVITFENL